MIVTIYYTDNYAEAPDAFERLIVPDDVEWGRWRVHFRTYAGVEPTEWCLAIEKYYSEDGKSFDWYHAENYCPLRHTCDTKEEYFAWLRENVMAIYLDMAPYWINPEYGNEDKVDNVADTEHGFTGGD